MKRNITVAVVTAAVLIGGGAIATTAFADDDSSGAKRTQAAGAGAVQERSGTAGPLTVHDAVAAALKAVPGTVTEAELDDDDDRDVWELDVYGSDKVRHEVSVDARTGEVRHHREDDDNDDRHAPRSAAVTLNSAADAALASVPGTVTSAGLDDDDDDDDRGSGALRWDVDIRGKDGRSHELHVDAKTGKVTADNDDRDDSDGRDDRGDDDGDDRGDDDN